MKRGPRMAEPHGCRAYTLLETLVAMGALVVVFGALGAALVQGLDTVARTRAACEAASSASMGLANAVNDIGDAAFLTLCGPDRVRYCRPSVGEDGRYVLPEEPPSEHTYVQPGQEVEVGLDQEGRLYRATVDHGGNGTELVGTEVVTDGVRSLTFQYDGKEGTAQTVPGEVRWVTVTVEAQPQSRPQGRSVRVTRTVKLRNHR